MDLMRVGLSLGILFIAGFLFFPPIITSGLSRRRIVVIVLTAILALVLLGAWCTGSVYDKHNVCGGCGGSGLFFGSRCSWCKGRGYETATHNDNGWCFWVATVVLAAGTILFYNIPPESNTRLKPKTAFIFTFVVGIILGFVEIFISSDAFSRIYQGVFSPVVGSKAWISGICAAAIWLLVVIVISFIASIIVKTVYRFKSKE